MSTIGYYICVPFAWLVRLFYNLTNSYGVALILFTLVIKLIMLPFQMKSKKSMMRMSRVSGQMQELQKRYAKNQAKLQEEMQKLYEEEGVNPMSGCLWSFLPFPILIALYSIIRQPITHFMMLPESAVETLIQTATNAGVNMANIVQLDKAGAAIVKNGVTQLSAYGQINLVKAVQEMGLSTPDGWFNVNYKFLGLDLTATPWEYVKSFTFTWAVIGVILIPILAGLSQFVFSKLTMKTQPQADAAGGASMKSMMYMMPLFSVYIAFVMPAALGVYWIAQSVFSLIRRRSSTRLCLLRWSGRRKPVSRLVRLTARSVWKRLASRSGRDSRMSRSRLCVKSSRLLRLPRLSKLPRPLPAPPRLAGWVTAPMPVAVLTRRTAMTKHNEEPL